MPLNPDPLAALKALLSSAPDLNTDDPTGMVQGRLGQESQAEEDMRRYQNVSAAPRGTAVSGAAPSTFKHLADTLGASPNFGDAAQERVAGINKANDAAMQAGFTGDRDITGSWDGGGNELGHHLYANVGGGQLDGLNPAQRAGQSAVLAARYKEDAPVREAIAKARAETEGRIRQNEATHALINGDVRAAQQGAQGAPPAGPPAGPSAPAAPPQAPKAPQSFMDQLKGFVTGNGEPYNGLSDLLQARGNKMLSGISHTPESTLIQENLLGNAQSLAGIFPSSRAAGVLSKIAQDFQSNYGSETPANSHARLLSQINALDKAELEFDDPQYRMKTGANGMLEPAATNQTIQRAKLAIATSRGTLQRALQQMEQLHPGIGGTQMIQTPGPGAPVAPASQGGSRFERIGGQ